MLESQNLSIEPESVEETKEKDANDNGLNQSQSILISSVTCSTSLIDIYQPSPTLNSKTLSKQSKFWSHSNLIQIY